jgi:hypothetical protein
MENEIPFLENKRNREQEVSLAEQVNVNDVLDVFCENENTYLQARVLQIKEDKSNEKYFYVHFFNYEKRMDRWVSEKCIRKILGNKDIVKFKKFI